jgi:uncharacterized repeat protein (TIGR01451 family)
MHTCLRHQRRLSGLILDLLLGLFILVLIVMIWLPSQSGAKAEGAVGDTGGAASVTLGSPRAPLTPVQGTPIVATINGSIDGTEATFTGQRHFRSGIQGDRNCALFGTLGSRRYDEFKFFNNSSTSQRVSIGFTSGCGNNTYMAAYSPQFDATSICENFIASPGSSGSTVWDFTVCANSQFSIVVYGLEPGFTCGSYSFTVYANNAVFIGGPLQAPGAQPSTVGDGSPVAASDVVLKRHKHKIPGTDTRLELVVPTGTPPPITGLLPIQGTPLVAVINDSISAADPAFIGQRHFITGIPGDGNCSLFGPIGSHFYDEVFFRNNSPNIETVEIQPTGGCVSSQGPVTIIAAYSTQFDPNDICHGFIAVSSFPSGGSWRFRVCPNTQFSIVVYGASTGFTCPAYSYNVFSASTAVTLIGSATDLSVSKTGTAGPVAVGSNIAYNITFTNNGPRPAGGVVFTDLLPTGVTFVSLSLLSNLGTALPAPVCMTPPVGEGGTISCSMNLLGIPGTALINSITYILTAQVGPAAGETVVNTASISHQGPDPNTNNNSSSVTSTITRPFDLCLQDDSSRSVLQLNSITGDYLFTSCQGVSVGGRGSVTVKGAIATLQDSGVDRRILAKVDGSVMKGTATVQLFAPARLFTITDRNTADNTCSCP